MHHNLEISTCVPFKYKKWQFLTYSINMHGESIIMTVSGGMRFPTMWYVRPSKAQTSLRIRAD